jgi:RimJ/RimL family protein N-acetyltransferase
VEHDDLTLRPLGGRDELALFNQLPYTLNDELADDLDAGRRRPGWLWVAHRGPDLLARAAWWGRPDDRVPALLDVLDLADAGEAGARVALGERLLRTAIAAVLPGGEHPPEYTRHVPADWRADAASRRAIEERMAVAGRCGARLFVERLRLEWRPGTPVPGPGGRLRFRPLGDVDELLALMEQALDGTLDAHSAADLAHLSPREAARRHYEGELARYTSPRDWWRVATLPGGEPVGFVVAAHNGYNPIIAYLAVLPAHRGNGYVDDVLAEGTRVLAAQGMPRIRASTDLGNIPMAGAFTRAGYVDFEHTLDMVWD